MRNLKKVLALVLAMAMALSLAVSAGAAFNDQDKIVNEEAVDMCVALNIINGYTDGSFKPEGNVTRAEAAKMITIALNGGKEPTLSASATPTYSDIAGHWAAKYIEYCTSLGIVAGDGAGKFNPNGNVKAVELAKMLLIAIGYSADAEKFVGGNWDTNVNVIASQKDLYAGLESIDPAAAATRDTAAQMVWNAMQAVMVDYKYMLSTDAAGNLVSELKVYDLGEDDTLLETKYGYAMDMAVITDVVYDDEDEIYTTYYYMLDEDYAAVSNEKSFDSAEDYSALFLLPVTIVTDKDGEVVGIAQEDAEVLASGTVEDVDLDKIDGDNKMTIADAEYKLDVADEEVLALTFEYLNLAAAEVMMMEQPAEADASLAFEIELIDMDGNGKGDYIIFYPVYAEQVEYVGTQTVRTDADSYSFEDDTIYAEVAEDDYVIVTKAENTVDGKNVVVAAEITTATVSATKAGEVKIDGVWYTNEAGTLKNNTEYDFVILNDVIYYAVETEESSSDLLFVGAVDTFDVALGETEGTYDVKAYFADGSDAAVVTVSYVGGDKCTEGNAPAENTLYTYTKSGDNYKLEAVATDDEIGDYDAAVIGAEGGWVAEDELFADTKVADDAVIFVVSADGVSVAKGADVNKWKNDFAGECGYMTTTTRGIAYVGVGYVIADAESPVKGGDDMYGYVVAESYVAGAKDADGEDIDVTVIEIWNGSEYVELMTEDTTNEYALGDFIVYSADGDFYEVDEAGAVMAAVTALGDTDNCIIDYMTAYDVYDEDVDLDEDVVVIGFNSKDETKCDALTLAQIKEAAEPFEGGIIPNAFVVVDTNGLVIAIFADVNNELVGADDEVIVWTAEVEAE